ncbi:MAG: hypothetical protein ACXWTK_09915 [Methylobacter sp.]
MTPKTVGISLRIAAQARAFIAIAGFGILLVHAGMILFLFSSNPDTSTHPSGTDRIPPMGSG